MTPYGSEWTSGAFKYQGKTKKNECPWPITGHLPLLLG